MRNRVRPVGCDHNCAIQIKNPYASIRTFLFGDYEGSRLRESVPFLSTVPTATERAGDFRDRLTGQTFSPCATPRPGDTFDTGTIFDPAVATPYTCADGASILLRQPIRYLGQINLIPPVGAGPAGGSIDPVGQNVANFYPPPTSSGLVNNYRANQKHVNSQDQFDIRMDNRFRDQDQMFASYSFGDVRSQRPGPLGPLWGGLGCCPSVSNSRAQHLGP